MLSRLRRRTSHLGHAGLIPLVGLALLVWLVTPDLQPWGGLAPAAYAALAVQPRRDAGKGVDCPVYARRYVGHRRPQRLGPREAAARA